jgi:nicotinic acid mononucleotide adenylyltransferase
MTLVGKVSNIEQLPALGSGYLLRVQLKKHVEMPVPHATLPANERGTRSLVNANDTVRWLELADAALRLALTEEQLAKTEVLARTEQEAIKKHIRRTAETVKRQSKSKQ